MERLCPSRRKGKFSASTKQTPEERKSGSDYPLITQKEKGAEAQTWGEGGKVHPLSSTREGTTIRFSGGWKRGDNFVTLLQEGGFIYLLQRGGNSPSNYR